MLEAAIDVGSNTLRMLLAPAGNNDKRGDYRYFREITRLAGGFDPEIGLNPASVERTLLALERFAAELKAHRVVRCKAVGTAVLRQAANAAQFVEAAFVRSGIRIEVIDGRREAGLSCRGILSVLDPIPQSALLFDVGGGSTEILLLNNRQVVYQTSLSLGVVRLLEQFSDATERAGYIVNLLRHLPAEKSWQDGLAQLGKLELIGTAGTVTTLAAMKLQMTRYVGARVNNLVLQRSWLQELLPLLSAMSSEQRRQLPGLEAGREDIIIPGLQLIEGLFDLTGCEALRVADAGLLEGLLLE